MVGVVAQYNTGGVVTRKQPNAQDGPDGQRLGEGARGRVGDWVKDREDRDRIDRMKKDIQDR